MQGINRKQHGHLVDALFQTEMLLSDRQKDYSSSKQAQDYKRDLESIYRNYERLLKELSEEITYLWDFVQRGKGAVPGQDAKRAEKGNFD